MSDNAIRSVGKRRTPQERRVSEEKRSQLRIDTFSYIFSVRAHWLAQTLHTATTSLVSHVLRLIPKKRASGIST